MQRAEQADAGEREGEGPGGGVEGQGGYVQSSIFGMDMYREGIRKVPLRMRFLNKPQTQQPLSFKRPGEDTF